MLWKKPIDHEIHGRKAQNKTVTHVLIVYPVLMN